jgi:hypothetical protein
LLLTGICGSLDPILRPVPVPELAWAWYRAHRPGLVIAVAVLVAARLIRPLTGK